jgi:hypothetical protein
MEALKWLTENKNKSAFASNCFGNTKSAIDFVKKLYKAGAAKVEVDGLFDEDWRIKEEGGPYADVLLVHLPKNKSKRLELVPVVYSFRPDELDGDWNGSDPIRLWWD